MASNHDHMDDSWENRVMGAMAREHNDALLSEFAEREECANSIFYRMAMSAGPFAYPWEGIRLIGQRPPRELRRMARNQVVAANGAAMRYPIAVMPKDCGRILLPTAARHRSARADLNLPPDRQAYTFPRLGLSQNGWQVLFHRLRLRGTICYAQD